MHTFTLVILFQKYFTMILYFKLLYREYNSCILIGLTDQLKIVPATSQLGLGLSLAIKCTIKLKLLLAKNVTFRIQSMRK